MPAYLPACLLLLYRYYMCGGDSIVSGSSEERLVRIHCTATGEMLACTDMHPGRRNPLLYVAEATRTRTRARESGRRYHLISNA